MMKRERVTNACVYERKRGGFCMISCKECDDVLHDMPSTIASLSSSNLVPVNSKRLPDL